MNILSNKSLSVIAILSVFILLSGCNSATINKTKHQTNNSQDLKQYSDKDHAVAIVSEGKKYKVSLYSQSYPLQTGKIYNLILNLSTPDDKPLDNVKIYVHGGMPQHQHGFPTSPRVKKSLGNGDYLVEGVKFSMPGDWEIRFNIKEKTKRDRAIFHIKI